MKLLVRFLLAGLLSVALTAQGESGKGSAEVDTDQLLKDYRSSWSIADPAERIAMLQKIWIEEGVHESPFGRSEGIGAISREIEGFLKMFPGARVAFEDIRQTGSHIVCTFILKNPDGSVVMTGIDYFEFNEAGKLLKVVGFVARQ